MFKFIFAIEDSQFIIHSAQ